MSKFSIVNTIVSAIGGAAIGGTVVYLWNKKRTEKYIADEVQKAREYYQKVDSDSDGEKEDEYGLPKVTRSQVETMIEDLGYAPKAPSTTNVFDMEPSIEEVGPELTGPNGHPIQVDGPAGDLPEDYEFRPDEPYIISQEQMFNECEEYEKPTLSYYAGDDTLIDEREDIIHDRDRYIGDRHLSMFGILSDDENVVYVRNHKISSDFEIIREPGKFSDFFRGQLEEDEPKSRKTPKFNKD